MQIEADVIVIGAGPAGIACACQLKRQGMSVILIERGQPGGLIRNASLVENYPGFPDGIPGPELADKMARHLEAHEIQSIRAEASAVHYVDSYWEVFTGNGKVHTARAVVLATGSTPKVPEWYDPSSPAAGRVYFDIVSVDREISGKEAIVVGGGDVAFDYALSMSKLGATVTILSRGEPRCIPLLRERALTGVGIVLETGDSIESISLSDDDLLEIVLQGGGSISGIEILLVAVGRKPNIENLLPVELAGCHWAFRLAGDARNMVRQVVSAAGDGTRIAMELASLLGGGTR